jgi:hypothetical protein
MRFDTVKTLPEREFRAGLAEVIKYGIIYDAKLFARLEHNLPKLLKRDRKLLAAVVARCCEIKAEVVGQDETDGGLRAILNFGHTIGHAIENISGYGKFLHGEAIAIGQVAAAKISHKILGLPERDAARIENVFSRAGLPVQTDDSGFGQLRFVHLQPRPISGRAGRGHAGEAQRRDFLDQIRALKPERILVSPGPCSPRESGLSNDVIRTFAGKAFRFLASASAISASATRSARKSS